MKKKMDTNFDFNKTGKFDFGKVGKRMPYSTPEGFFKEMEATILEQVKNETQPVRIQPKKRSLRKVIWTAAIAVAASVAVLLVLNIDFSASSSQPSQVNNGMQEVDKAFAQLSSADQAYLLSVYQEDVFLNN